MSQYFLWWISYFEFYCKFKRIFYTVYPCWIEVAISFIFKTLLLTPNFLTVLDMYEYQHKKKTTTWKSHDFKIKVTFFSVISLTRLTVISVIYIDLPKTVSFRSLFCCDSRCGTLHCHTQECRRPVRSGYDEGRKSHSPGVLPRIIWPCGWVSLQWNHGRFRSKGCLKGNNPLVPTSLISHIFTNNKGV